MTNTLNLDEYLLVITKENYGEAYYKFALTGSSSDLPATRKLYGFTSHNATKSKL